MFVKAKAGELGGFSLPSHEIEIFSAMFLGMRTITNDELLDRVTTDTKTVRGDFRQEQTRAVWEAHLRPLYGISFEIVRFAIRCTSGTYMRVIANDLGTPFCLPSVAYSIVRTKVGKYGIKKALRE